MIAAVDATVAASDVPAGSAGLENAGAQGAAVGNAGVEGAVAGNVGTGAGEAAAGTRSLSGEKAQRIVEAMRRSVAKRGAAASTFEHVSREAGVSRGLLHYYFATKEQLLVEAVRRDCELRLEILERQLAGAQTADDFIALMAQNLQETVSEDPDFVTLVFELFTLSRRNAEIAAEYTALMRRTREQVAGMLASAQDEGVLRLHADPEAVAEILFSLGDGFALRMLAEPERDFTATIRAGIVCVRALLAD
jgi:AcrR family transcriptional regulator